MKKLDPIRKWELAKSVASHFKSLDYSESELMEMDKHEMSSKFGESLISEMPDKTSMFDGKDIDEEDTFPYFQTLVKFHFAILRKESVDESSVK